MRRSWGSRSLIIMPSPLLTEFPYLVTVASNLSLFKIPSGCKNSAPDHFTGGISDGRTACSSSLLNPLACNPVDSPVRCPCDTVKVLALVRGNVLIAS